MELTKDKIQDKALKEALLYRIYVLQWCTSLGKSRVALRLIEEVAKQAKPIKVLLVVAEIAHKKNWLEEAKKWSIDLSDIYLEIECYASLKKASPKYDIVIYDEVHRAFSDLRVDLIKDIKADYIIGLSATLEMGMLNTLKSIYGDFGISTYTLRFAIDNGLLPEPSIYLIPLTLDKTNKSETIVINQGKASLAKHYTTDYSCRWSYPRTKYPNLCLTLKCTQQEKYNYYTERFEYFKRQFFNTQSEAVKNRWMQAGTERKRFLGDIKTSYVAPLLYLVKDKRYVCFCANIKQADFFCSDTSIHSKKKGSQDIIEQFNNKEIDTLYPVNMIQEGQNLVDLDLGIIVQLDGKERSFIQRAGRFFRAEKPVIFIFYYKNTRDEEFLKNVLEGLDEQFIRSVSINEVKELLCK